MNLFKAQPDDLPLLAIRPEDCTTEEQLAAQIGGQANSFLPNRGLYVYWLRSDRNMLDLQATLMPNLPVKVRPDYAGLVEELGLTPVPLSLDPGDLAQPTRQWGAPDEPWLDLVVGDALLLRYRLHPRQSVSEPVKALLAKWCRQSAGCVTMAHAMLVKQHEVMRLQTLFQSTQTAMNTLVRPEVAAEPLLDLAGSLIGAQDGAVLIAGPVAGSWRAVAAKGSGLPWWEAWQKRTGHDWPLALVELPWNGAPEPAARFLIAVPALTDGRVVGGIFLFVPSLPTWDDYQRIALLTLGERVGQLAALQQTAQQMSKTYVHSLRHLIEAMDSQSLHSLGHAERMARYARLIATEIGLDAELVEAVAMAAYVHDVGMITIPPAVVRKSARLTAVEYEQIKNHAEVGAQLVAAVQAAEPIAPMVAAHHERWDGLGYPRGTKGTEIPLGARIIAVADLFEAKTTGRSYRPALPYDQALIELRAASGSQLDPELVEALERALGRLRAAGASDRAASPCWEAKQLNARICGECPNRVNRAVACWKQPERLCARHGDDCSTCSVYTEYMGRVPGAVSPSELLH